MITRRAILGGAALAGATAAVGSRIAHAAPNEGGLKLPPELAEGTRESVVLDALPGKQPLIKLSYRPPNYETPTTLLRSAITPNDAFFVRYHLADIPEVDAKSWRLSIGGEGANAPFDVSLDELKKLPSVEVVAVCQCSGNRRGIFTPHVPGVQWGYGAMGCARWKGARLKDVLDRAGVKKEAMEVVFDGADKGIVDKTPDFVKSIPLWKAVEDTTLVAYEMNGQPLPHWNGFPARIVVPGWTATYWVKHLTSIALATKPFDGFWMKSAYRIPNGKFPLIGRFDSQTTAANTPITEMMVNSLITSHERGASVKAGSPFTISGLAWDGGYGIKAVEVSTDGGRSWSSAQLGEDLGPFAFRTWSQSASLAGRGERIIMARAFNRAGQTQTMELIQNPAGYHHNVIQSVNVMVS